MIPQTQLKLISSVLTKHNIFLFAYAFLTLGIKKFPVLEVKEKTFIFA